MCIFTERRQQQQQQQKRVGSQVEDPPFSRYFNVHVCVGLIVRFSFPCYSTASAICAALWSSYIPYSNQCYSFLPLAHPRVPCIILQSCIALDVCILQKYTHTYETNYLRKTIFSKQLFYIRHGRVHEHCLVWQCNGFLWNFLPPCMGKHTFFLFFYSRQFCVPSWQAINRQEKMLRDAAELFCSTQYTILDVLTLHLQDNKILSNGRQGQSLI